MLYVVHEKLSRSIGYSLLKSLIGPSDLYQPGNGGRDSCDQHDEVQEIALICPAY